MDEKIIEVIVEHSKNGSKILFGRSRLGSVKIKVNHGPLGLLTTRYQLDAETYNEVKRRLKSLGEDG